MWRGTPSATSWPFSRVSITAPVRSPTRLQLFKKKKKKKEGSCLKMYLNPLGKMWFSTLREANKSLLTLSTFRLQVKGKDVMSTQASHPPRLFLMLHLDAWQLSQCSVWGSIMSPWQTHLHSAFAPICQGSNHTGEARCCTFFWAVVVSSTYVCTMHPIFLLFFTRKLTWNGAKVLLQSWFTLRNRRV